MKRPIQRVLGEIVRSRGLFAAWAAMLLAAFGSACLPARAAISYTTLNPPNGGFDDTAIPVAIDGTNMIGSYLVQDNNAATVSYGFLYDTTSKSLTTISYSGGSGTSLLAIQGNNIVGSYLDGNSVKQGLLYSLSSHTFTTITPPSAAGAECLAVSASAIAGYSIDNGGTRHGFVYNLGTGTFTTIDPPNTIDTECLGLSGGTVTGFYLDSGNRAHGFVYDGTSYTTLDPSGSINTFVTGMSGTAVAGYYEDSSTNTHGFLYDTSSHTYATVDPPGTTSTLINGISGNDVAGSYQDSNSTSHGFLYDLSAQTYTTIDPAADTFAAAYGYANGLVVGQFSDGSANPHYFVANLSGSGGGGGGSTTAKVTLGGLAATYNGGPHAVIVTTVPANLITAVTYDGSGTAPTNAGSYVVQATVTQSGYTGSATGTLTILPAKATVTLGSLSASYTGSAQIPSVTTNPPGLSTSVTYNGSGTAPVAAGSYAVVATITDPNYTGSAKGTFVISKAAAQVMLGDLSATYDGTAQPATAATTPSGLTVNLTYNNSATAPTNAGSYKVVGTVSDPNYSGSATGTLVIAKADADVSLTDSSLAATYTGKAAVVTSTTTPAGLPVKYAYTLNGKAATPINAGTYVVTASVSTANAAGSTTGTLVISPATATVTLGNLTPTYTGRPIAATAATTPARLPVSFTYQPGGGSPVSTAPTLVGDYTVVGTVSNPNYSASATGTMSIAPVLPLATTGAATAISSSSATLTATVNPKGSDTTVVFQYTPASGTLTMTSSSVVVPAGTATVAVSIPVQSFLPGTLYHYQVYASNAAGTSNGLLKTFTTLPVPVPDTMPQTPPLLSASGVQVSFGVNPEGVATKVFFAYGTDSSALNFTTTPVSIGAGKTTVYTSAFLGSLLPNTIYYYEIVTQSAAGTFHGPLESFTTLGFDTSMVALSGDTANGSGGSYTSFSTPAINLSDGVAFSAKLATGGPITATNNAGIWANEGTSTLELVAQTGTLAPDTSANFATFVTSPVYNVNNAVAFDATLKVAAGQATAATDTGIWSSSSGDLRLIAREGDPAPGGSTFSQFVALGLSDINTIVVASMAAGNGVTAQTNEGVWEGTLESNLVPCLRTGDVVDGKTIAGPLVLNSSQALLQGQTRAFASNSGDLALLATFTDKTTGIVTSTGGTEALAYAPGDLAPSAGGATFAKFSVPIINTSDHVGFEATLAGSGVTTATNAGIWTEDSTGTLQLVARTGQSPTNFLTLGDPLTNNNDATAFAATYKSGAATVTGLFCNSTGTLTRVAQTGLPAAGCVSGVNFSAFKIMMLPDMGGATNRGGLVFAATLAGTGVTAANNTGIWAVDSSGTLQLIVRTGDTLNVGTDDAPVYKTISAIAFSAFNKTTAGQTTGVTKAGDLAYTATFTDKTSAIFAVQFP